MQNPFDSIQFVEEQSLTNEEDIHWLDSIFSSLFEEPTDVSPSYPINATLEDKENGFQTNSQTSDTSLSDKSKHPSTAQTECQATTSKKRPREVKQNKFVEEVKAALEHQFESNPCFIVRKCAKLGPKHTPYDHLKNDFVLK